jgi:hypothetical protein
MQTVAISAAEVDKFFALTEGHFRTPSTVREVVGRNMNGDAHERVILAP